MSLIHYNPWPLFDALRRDIDSNAPAPAANWQPRADILEFADRYEIHVDLPGVAAESVDLSVDDGVLTLSGERTLTSGDDAPERTRRERAAGQFERQFTLPRTIAATEVSAKAENGVLRIALPKQVEAQPIKVKVAA